MLRNAFFLTIGRNFLISNPVRNSGAFRTLSLIKKPDFLKCNENFAGLKITSNDYSTKKAKGGASKTTKPKVELRRDEIESVINYNELLKTMKDAVEHLKKDYNDNLNLRISPSSFEEIPVKTPSGTQRLGEIAQVEMKSANMYVIDLIRTPDYVKPVFDAIVKSKLNSNPQLDKTSVYLPIAKITREHRENMAKTAKTKSEQAIKKIKEAENKALRKAKENKTVSKDLAFNVQQHIKYQHDIYVQQANDIKDAKTKEILQSE